jgi:transcriptional regulator GlxA family with amidase domain
MALQIAIYVFPNVEVLDFAGPFEVFTTASRVMQRQQQPAPFKVFTVARTLEPVTARAGLRVLPDFSFADCPVPDVLVIPGGVVDAELTDTSVIDWVTRNAEPAQLVASVCTGAFVLAKAGLLTGRRATTHWEDIDDLRRMFPDVEVLEGRQWVDEGRIVSSAGIAAGIGMSLHLVGRLVGAQLAVATAKQMEVPYGDHPN